MTKPRVGVSACLLGQNVRFDGAHKKDEWLTSELAKFVTWHPLCPEVEMGLGIPRESVRLVRNSPRGHVRMVGNKSQTDHTENAKKTARKMIAACPELDGYVLKKNSPSCGQERVRIYSPEQIPDRTGIGLFAKELLAAFPDLPVIEEGRLSEAAQREHFVTRVFGRFRLRSVPARVKEIQKFHQNYKLLLMAHSPAHYQKLGRIAANPKKAVPSEVLAEYSLGFQEALAIPSTLGRRVNVLQHMFGYFRGKLDVKERKAIEENIQEYRRGELTLSAALTVIRHTVRRIGSEYLDDQLYFDPYPKALALRKYL